MDRQQIAVKLSTDVLGLPFQINTFQDRLILQKAVYLVQAAKINLGYYYHWYLHGPYCSSLARDKSVIVSELSQSLDDSKGWNLDSGSLLRLEQLKDLISGGDRAKLERKLELLASIHFLVDRKQVARNNVQEITATLKRFEKNFTEDEVEGGLKELIRYGLLQS